MSQLTAAEQLYQTLDQRTINLLERRRDSFSLKRRGWLLRRALLISDVAGLSAAFLIAQGAYLAHASVRDHLSQLSEFVVFAFSLPLWVVAAKTYGLYDKDEERTDHSTADEFSRIFHLVTVCTFLLYGVAHMTTWFAPQFAKLWLFWVIAIASTVTFRGIARAICRRQIHYVQNTVIVGAGEVGQTIARKLLKHPEYGLNLVGFVDTDPKERARGLEHLTILGDPGDLPELVSLLDVERVIYAFSNEVHDESLEMIRRLNALDVQVDIVPRFFEVLSAGVGVHTIEGIPVVGLPPGRLPRSSRLIKRFVDVLASAIGLVLLIPAFLVVALAIKLDSSGPVFFRQTRMGAGGRTFRIWKFRTMTSDAEERKHQLAHLNKHLAAGGDARMFKIDNDPRVTTVGRLLRRWSLDELPQLWNVLRGEMSLVGPRPLILDEHRHVNSWAHRRLDLRPGITGLWQVLGRDGIAFDEMVKLDYLYVTSWSIANDIRLLIRTVPIALRQSG